MGEEGQGGGAGSGAPAAIEYKFALPEGSGLDKSDVESLTEFAKTQNWTQEQADAELGRRNAVVESFRKRSAPVIPDSYALKAPDGSNLDKSHLDAVAALGKEKKLTQEQAQLVLDQRHAAIADEMRRQREAMTAQTAEWNNTLKTEWGNDFDGNVQTAKRGLDWIEKQNPELRKSVDEFLKASGLSDNPTVMNLFLAIGKANKEDGAGPRGGPGGADEPKDFVGRFAAHAYGSSK